MKTYLLRTLLTGTNTPSTWAVYLNASDFKLFKAQRRTAGVTLQWAVANPLVVSFRIERSLDGISFETIGHMLVGTQEEHLFHDEAFCSGSLHYRIVAIRSSGSEVHSTIKTVRAVLGKV